MHHQYSNRMLPTFYLATVSPFRTLNGVRGSLGLLTCLP